MVLTERVPFARHWASRLSTECSFAKLLGVCLYGPPSFCSGPRINLCARCLFDYLEIEHANS